jgi:hypothetical protein
VEVQLHAFWTSALRGGELLASRPSRSEVRTPVSFGYEAEWAEVYVVPNKLFQDTSIVRRLRWHVVLITKATVSQVGGTWAWFSSSRNDKAAIITGDNYPTKRSYITRPSLQVSTDTRQRAPFPYAAALRSVDGMQAVSKGRVSFVYAHLPGCLEASRKVKQSRCAMQAPRRRGSIAPTHSWPRHLMEASGQRHNPAALYPREMTPVPIG